MSLLGSFNHLLTYLAIQLVHIWADWGAGCTFTTKLGRLLSQTRKVIETGEEENTLDKKVQEWEKLQQEVIPMFGEDFFEVVYGPRPIAPEKSAERKSETFFYVIRFD